MELVLEEKKWHNDEIYSLKFIRPTDFSFKPGQFMTVFLDVDGKTEKRGYSFSSSPPEKDFLMFTIKKEKFVSKKLSEFETGDKLEVKGPFGIFFLDESSDNIVMIAGGTGITPFRAMSKYIFDKGLQIKATLFFSARTKNDLIFREEFEYMSKNKKNFRFFPTTTRDDNFEGHKGKIDEKFLKDGIDNFGSSLFYICGPKTFVEIIAQILLKLKVEKSRIKVDKWG